MEFTLKLTPATAPSEAAVSPAYIHRGLGATAAAAAGRRAARREELRLSTSLIFPRSTLPDSLTTDVPPSVILPLCKISRGYFAVTVYLATPFPFFSLFFSLFFLFFFSPSISFFFILSSACCYGQSWRLCFTSPPRCPFDILIQCSLSTF